MFLVIGMPGEKIDDMRKSFKFAADCKCYEPHVSVATPYPGTALYDECIKKGYFARQFTLDDLFIKSFIIETPDWDEKNLRKILEKGHLYLLYRKFRDNPFLIFKKLIEKFKNPSLIIDYLKRIFSLFK